MLPIQPAEDLYQGQLQAKGTIEIAQTRSKPSLGILLLLAIPFILVFSIFGFLLKLMSSFTGRNRL